MTRGYWIVRVDVRDAEAYKAYAAADGAAFAAFGGRFLVRGGAFESVAGTARARNVRPEHREVAIDPARLPGLAGRYGLAPSLALTVRLENDPLTGQIDGQPAFELVPEGGNAFFLREVDAQVTFETDAAGRATGLVLHQNGLDMPAPRLDGAEAAARPGALRSSAVVHGGKGRQTARLGLGGLRRGPRAAPRPPEIRVPAQVFSGTPGALA